MGDASAEGENTPSPEGEEAKPETIEAPAEPEAAPAEESKPAEAEPEAKAEPEAQAESEAKAEPEAESAAKTEPEAAAEPEAKAEEAKGEPEGQVEPEAPPEEVKEEKAEDVKAEEETAKTPSKSKSLQKVDAAKKSGSGIAHVKGETKSKVNITEEKRVTSTMSLGKKTASKISRTRSDVLSSKAKLVLGSVISIRRASMTGEYYDRSKIPRYMNSYKLFSDNPFNPEKVHKILESVMVEAMENLAYDPDKCPKQAKWASGAIRAKVKELEFDRYKLICLVTIGERNLQDVFVTCRFLWDAERDRYAIYTYENINVFGIAQCFGLYYE